MQLEPSCVLHAGLSGRELEVLLALAHGGSNREIADGLGISAKTVGHHVQNIYAKAGVRNRAAATRWAFEQDLVRGRRPDQAYLFYNVACCESLAGRAGEAIEHLRRAIELRDGCREMARHDSDFDPIRDESGFTTLVGD